MSRKTVSGIMLSLLLIGMLILTFNIQPVKASGTIYIKADGSVEGTTYITSDDNVTYTFTDNIFNQSIIVERDNIVVDGAGYILQGTGSGEGIELSGISNVTIKNTNIKAFGLGIWLFKSSGNTITNNNIEYSGYGIQLRYNSNRNTIMGNTIKGIEVSPSRFYDYGLYLYDSHNNTISSNTITDSGTGVLVGCLWSTHPSTGNTITNNNLTNNECGIWVVSDSGGNAIANNYGGSIMLYISGSGGNTLTGNNLTDLSIGTGNLSEYLLQEIDVSNIVNGKPVYYLINQSNLLIDPFTFPEIGYLALVNSANITVKNLIPTVQGILLAYTTNSTIENMNITNSLGDGILLVHSGDNIIVGNSIIDNFRGITLRHSNGNTITNNNITNNYGVGVWLIGSNNTLSGNNITNNGSGSSVIGSGNTITNNNILNNGYDGIVLHSGNTIYHNNLINNTIQATISSAGPNTWDDGYPSGGNYWGDYNGTDANQDGIGDISYIIDADNQDRYPLMGPISFFNACTWDETTHYVHTVSNSTVSDYYFSRDDKLVSFNVNGTSDTVGFCRVTIPRELIWCDYLDEWNVTINDNPPTYLNATEDDDYTYLYFTYNHSIQEVEIRGIHVIPEFPTWTSVLFILMVLTVVIAIYKRRLLKTPAH